MLLHIEFIFNEHILSRSKKSIVQIQLTDGIQPAAIENYLIFFKKTFVCIESTLVFPFLLFHPLCVEFIVTEKRIPQLS
jgi:hypothetical protein